MVANSPGERPPPIVAVPDAPRARAPEIGGSLVVAIGFGSFVARLGARAPVRGSRSTWYAVWDRASAAFRFQIRPARPCRHAGVTGRASAILRLGFRPQQTLATREARTMKLNHVNLTVTDVRAA